MKTADGRLYVIGGASRSGKTAWVVQHSAKARRLAAWDPDAQWCDLPGWRKVTSKAELLKALTTPGPCKVAFVVGGDLAAGFEFWCGVVLYAATYVEPLSAIAEELADTTTPSKAPPKWGLVTRRGLKRGLTIYAISQRWAEADKTAFGNASMYVIFRQSSADDARYFSRKTSIPVEQIAALNTEFWPGTQDVKRAPFLTRDALTHEIGSGALNFKRRR